ncbi:MAG: hypothetical protein ACT452_16185 [Microthrixaceae bacterium]
MVKKVLVLAALLLFATAGVAQAQTYPPEGNTLTANDTTVAPGDPITLTAQTYQVGASVTFTMFSAPVVLGSATANSSGVATLTTTIPAGTTSGTHRVEATGTGANGQPLTLVLSITVGPAGMPVTGTANTTPMTQIAIGALAAGGLLMLMANKRRSAKADARETASV